MAKIKRTRSRPRQIVQKNITSAESKTSGSEITWEWFRRLEVILEKEARLAGLLEHKTSIGSAREFFVTRVLRSIVPPIVHIGSGHVFDGAGKRSKQIDVVVYD